MLECHASSQPLEELMAPELGDSYSLATRPPTMWESGCDSFM